jgi:tetratricopeptide (TPR) repeat protein
MDVFLSYNRLDAGHAEALNDWLVSQGVRTFFDQRDLGGGQLWVADLERTIEHEVQAIAVLVGPNGIGNTQQYEYQLALTRQAKDRDFPLIPVVLPGTENRQLPRGFLGLQTWVSFAGAAGGTASPDQLQRLLAAIRREHAAADTIRGTICPYKGLEAFAEEDAALFFGRDDETAELHRTILAHRVAAMIGRSGTGKSSLVRAGLLPRLRQPDASGWGSVWDSLIIRPGPSPLTELARVLSPGLADEDPHDRFRRLERLAADWRTDHSGTLARFLRDRMGQARLHVNRLLIVIDQAEELFARPWHVRDAADAKRFHDDAEQFIKLLLGATEDGTASVALTIRSDYFDPLMHSAFGPVLKDALVQLGRIADLRPNIERPAATVGLTFSPGLVDRIVAEVGADESNLPLLQHALQRTWELRDGPVLSANAYTASGGVAKAINQAAEACYHGLTPDEQAAAKRLFLRLVRPGEGNAHLRQRTPVPADTLEQKVMNVFAAPDRRLLFVGMPEGGMTGGGMTGGKQEVEVAHEALVRGWPTLLEWVETSRERLRTRDDVLQWLHQPGTTPEMMPALRLVHRAQDLVVDPGDVPVDDLRDVITRWVKRERWQRNRTKIIAGTVIAALTVLSGAALLEWRSSAQESLRAQAERDRSQANLEVSRDAASGLVFDLARGLRNQTGVPLAMVRKVLDVAMSMLDRLTVSSPDDRPLLRLRGVALSEFSRTYASFGDTVRQRSAAMEALTIDRRLADSEPGDLGHSSDIAHDDIDIGLADVSQGNLPEALKFYRDGVAIRERLMRAEPQNTNWQLGVAQSYDNVADVLVAEGNLTDALKFRQDANAIFVRLARAAPDNERWQRELAVSDNKVGEVLVKRGNLPDALNHFRESMELSDRLARSDPSNAGWQLDLAVADDNVADVMIAEGKLEDAQSYRQDGNRIFARLAESDPNNAEWQRELSVSTDKVGDVLAARGNLAEALKSYRGSLGIRQRLTRADPSNAGWQLDLAVSYDNVADVLVAEGNLPDALKFRLDGNAIFTRLANADPDNAGWQRELSVSDNRIGAVQVRRGNLPEALKAYRDSLAIRERLTKSDPNNAEWRADYSESLDRVGHVLVKQGNLTEALKDFLEGMEIRRLLAQADPNNAGWQVNLAASFDDIGDVLVAEGNLPEALKSYRGSLDIRQTLTTSDSNNAQWKDDLSDSFTKVGEVQIKLGDLPDAMKNFRDGLEIVDRLAKGDSSNEDLQLDLAAAYDNIGDVLVAESKLPEALKFRQDANTIFARLAQSDPNNAGWQRELSVSDDKIGEVFVRQDKLPEALKYYRDSLAIRQQLTKSDPNNAGWQSDLSESFDNLGEVLARQNDLAGALKQFRDSQAAREQLSKSDPNNAGWQLDLAVSYDNIADVMEAQGNPSDGLKNRRDAHEIFARLAKSDPDNAGWQRELAVSYSRLAEAQRKTGASASALTALRQGQTIMQRMTQLSPDNPAWKEELGWFNDQIAHAGK